MSLMVVVSWELGEHSIGGFSPSGRGRCENVDRPKMRFTVAEVGEKGNIVVTQKNGATGKRYWKRKASSSSTVSSHKKKGRTT